MDVTAASRVLIVEDDPDVLDLLVMNLQDEFEVSGATSAEQALALLANATYDVVLTDHQLPGQTGTWLLNQVKSNHPQAHRILMSGCMRDGFLVDIRSDSIQKFLEKPIDIDLIMAAIREK